MSEVHYCTAHEYEDDEYHVEFAAGGSEACGRPAHLKIPLPQQGIDLWLCAEHFDLWVELWGEPNFK